MPRKRRRGILHRRALTLDDVSPPGLLDLCSGWHPRESGERALLQREWSTWEEFLGAYAGLREEFLASGLAQARHGTPFAEWLYVRTGGDPARVADLERAGQPIVDEEVRRYPATYLHPVWALWRQEVPRAA